MSFRTAFSVVAVLAWMIAITCGVTFAIGFDQTPGATQAAPRDWPLGTTLVRSDKPSVVMFVHPRCPCTRASLVELNEVLLKSGGPVDATIVLMYPPGAPARWTETDIASMASGISGVRILHDLDGREARRFGAETSGDAMLYSRDGQLLFRGGITQSRGHQGGNPAADALLRLLNDKPAGLTRTPIFGCPLFDEKTP